MFQPPSCGEGEGTGGDETLGGQTQVLLLQRTCSVTLCSPLTSLGVSDQSHENMVPASQVADPSCICSFLNNQSCECNSY